MICCIKLKMWFHCGYRASKSANLVLSAAWQLHIRLMEKGGRDLLSQTKRGLCALGGCRTQHTGITQDVFYNSAHTRTQGYKIEEVARPQGTWQQPQFSHTHKQGGNLAPCSWHLRTSHSSYRSPRSFSHGVQDPALLTMEISLGVNTSILSGIGLAKLVGYTSIIFGKIQRSGT